MFAEKPSFTTSNPSKLRLPSIAQSLRGQPRSPSPSTSSQSSLGINTGHIAGSIAELKAKYTDYITWLKTVSRHSRGPLLTQELTKNSLCQKGIDLVKAEQLVSTCSWYVYQFQKDLKTDPEQKDQSAVIKPKNQTQRRKKSKKSPTRKYNVEDSTTTVAALDKDDSLPSNSHSPIRHNNLVLPSIQISDLSTSSRSRHVDFNYEKSNNLISNPSPLPSHWRAAIVKTRVISKLQPLSRQSPNDDFPIDFNSSSPQRNLYRHGLNAGHARSILRKQTSTSSSNASTDISGRKMFSRILTPASTNLNATPLGTRSKLLFGGSECFAQIMNELEQQNEKI